MQKKFANVKEVNKLKYFVNKVEIIQNKLKIEEKKFHATT